METDEDICPCFYSNMCYLPSLQIYLLPFPLPDQFKVLTNRHEIAEDLSLFYFSSLKALCNNKNRCVTLNFKKYSQFNQTVGYKLKLPLI